jgi:hypothetical protein
MTTDFYKVIDDLVVQALQCATEVIDANVEYDGDDISRWKAKAYSRGFEELQSYIKDITEIFEARLDILVAQKALEIIKGR